MTNPPLTAEQEQYVSDLIEARLGFSHESLDHQDGALLPRKISPSNTRGAAAAGKTLVVSSGVATWTDPNDAAFRTIHQATGYVPAATAAGDYVFLSTGGAVVAASGSLLGIPVRILVPTFYGSAAGKAQRIRINGTATMNGTGTGVTFGLRLFPIAAVAGGVGALTWTAGASPTLGSEVVTPAANGALTVSSVNLVFPAANHYVLGINVGGATAANSMIQFTLNLETFWV